MKPLRLLVPLVLTVVLWPMSAYAATSVIPRAQITAIAATTTTISLSWSPPPTIGSLVIGYRISVAPASDLARATTKTSPPQICATAFTGLLASTLYRVTLSTVYNNGRVVSYSQTIDTLPGIKSPVSSLSSATPYSVTVRWTSATTPARWPVTKYEVYAISASGTFRSPSVSYSPAHRSATIKGLKPNTLYVVLVMTFSNAIVPSVSLAVQTAPLTSG